MYHKQSFEGDHHHKGFGCGMHGRGWGAHWRQHMEQRFGGAFRRVPVNIEETDQAFELSLFAPALAKERIQLSVKDDTLKVKYEAAEQEQNTGDHYRRREYSNGSFERTFLLNGKVLTEQISAAYADGILKITLPKNPETNKPAQDIAVA